MTDRDDGILRFPSDEADDAVLGARLAAMYRALPPRPAADARQCAAAVLAEAARMPSGWRAAMPRQRWWWGAAAAGLLVAVTSRPWRAGESTRNADSAFTDAAARAVSPVAPRGSITPVAGGDAMRFDITIPAGASDVALVGDFNGWDERATPMLRRNGDGTWTAQVALPPGRHVYAFVVDGGRWLVDPLAPQVPDAGFGPANAIVVDGTR
jgi:hypothetical protein